MRRTQTCLTAVALVTACTVFGVAGTSNMTSAGSEGNVGFAAANGNLWAGYAGRTSTGAFTNVSANWIQPTVTCGTRDQFVDFWAGIDGDQTHGARSATVEQIGTQVVCHNKKATYRAFWETYPNPLQVIGSQSIVIRPGDDVQVGVNPNWSKRTVTLLIQVSRVGGSFGFSTTRSLPAGAYGTSAECVTEIPSGSIGTPNFGRVTFGDCGASTPAGSGELETPAAFWDRDVFSVVHRVATSAPIPNSGFRNTWLGS
jgi:hypothetical protein